MSIPVYSGIKRYFRNPPKPSKRVYGKGSRMTSGEVPKQVPNRDIQGPTGLEHVYYIVPSDLPCSMHTKY